MADTQLPDYPAQWGNKRAVTVDHYGPASYTTGGEVLGSTSSFNPSFLGDGGIDLVIAGGMSVSGTYWVMAQPIGTGVRRTYKLIWYLAGTWTQVTAATNLSAEVVRIAVIGR